jgi:hypothetical protein
MSAYQQVAVLRLAAKVALTQGGASVSPPDGYLDMAEGPVVVTRTGQGVVTFDLPVSLSEEEDQVKAWVTDGYGGEVGTAYSNGVSPEYRTITFSVTGPIGEIEGCCNAKDQNFLVKITRVRNADELA